ncbi:MAG: hypothetical protein GXP17_11580 [Gammaproteobacteria bacterium]|nr:hypothetical protein [Gammaproteobacteria bacterium]
MTWRTGFFTILLTVSGLSAFIPSAGLADNIETATAVSTANTTNDSTTVNDAKAAGAGCLAGGVLGSVVPVFGTLLGCAIGGVTGWWW